LLFSEYDKGIKMDPVGWYSVCPESLAEHIAERFYKTLGPDALVMDGMGGVGGNVIQFAKKFHVTFCVDLSMERLILAKHNAKVYGVEQKVEFIRADYTNLAPHWRTIDAINLSPPWGGPKYSRQNFDIDTDMEPSCYQLHELSLQLTPNICYQLPKNSNMDQLKDLARMSQTKYPLVYPKKILEHEDAYIHDQLKMAVIYFGGLINTQNQIECEEEYIQEESQSSNVTEMSTEAVISTPNKKSKHIEENTIHPKKKVKV
jgi:predicted RNA methylase